MQFHSFVLKMMMLWSFVAALLQKQNFFTLFCPCLTHLHQLCRMHFYSTRECWSKLLSVIHWHQLQWITFELSLRCNAFSAHIPVRTEKGCTRASMHFSFHLLFGTFMRNANINHIILSFYFNSNDEQVYITAQQLTVYHILAQTETAHVAYEACEDTDDADPIHFL